MVKVPWKVKDGIYYLKDDSKIANEIRLLQEQQFRRNSTDVFESLMIYSFNPASRIPKKDIPEAFREKNVDINPPFSARLK